MRINRIAGRGFQGAMAATLRARPVKEKMLIKGAGCVSEVADLLIGNVLLVTTPGTLKRGSIDELLSQMKDKGVNPVIFTGVKPDPDIECVEAGLDIYNRGRCNAIVAVGGGSVLDCAKIIGARVAKPKQKVKRMAGLLKIRAKLPFFVAIPTTAGTGSEITVAAVITDSSNSKKFTITDFCLQPDVAVLDPQLTLALPAKLTAETGMDAFTHAIEAYTNRFCSGRIDNIALNAMKLIAANIEKTVELAGDSQIWPLEESIRYRERMLLGSYYAGLAFTNGYVGYVHAIAHGLGALYHIPHGRACAIVLPYVLEGYGHVIDDDLDKIAMHLGLGYGNRVISQIRLWNEHFGIPEHVDELDDMGVDMIVRRALKEANPAYPVPAIWNRDKMKSVVSKLKSKY